MSDTGRDLRSSPAIIVASKENSDDAGVAVAAGLFPPRVVGTKTFIPLDAEQRSGLAELVRIGRMIRRTDGSYGTSTDMLMRNQVATLLKSRRFAVAGFSSEMVPTDKGRRTIAEEHDAAAATQSTHDPVQTDA